MGDFQICISVPLTTFFFDKIMIIQHIISHNQVRMISKKLPWSTYFSQNFIKFIFLTLTTKFETSFGYLHPSTFRQSSHPI